MLAKKASVTTSPDRGLQKELEYLYARRSAIDTLMKSLENYDRFRESRVDVEKRKSA